MTRAERFLALLQSFRRRRRAVAASDLAAEVGVSLRTLYRDIAALKAQGAPIEGEAGLGYILRPGFLLPPLMFSEDEIEALVLGSRWVASRGDAPLEQAASDALAKIGAVLPDHLRERVEVASLMVPARAHPPPPGIDLAALRLAIRRERKLRFAYRDGSGGGSVRIVWPFGLAFFEDVRIITAWCELRRDYRHFRVDRVSAPEVLDERYPRRRAMLLREWRAQVVPPTSRKPADRN